MSGRPRGRGDRGGSSRGRGDGGGRGDRGGPPRGRGDRGGRGGPSGGDRGRGGSVGPAIYDGIEGIPAPDNGVAQKEDTIMKSITSAPSAENVPDISSLSLRERFPQRPGYGTKGKPITLWANYFGIIPPKKAELYRYDIGISPDAMGKKRRRIVELFIKEGSVSDLGNSLATDFKSNLVSREEIDDEDLTDTILYRNDDEDEAGDRARSYKIKLTPTGQFEVSDLINYLTSSASDAAFAEETEVIQCLNIIFGHYPKSRPSSQLLSIGANKHYALSGRESRSFPLGGGLQAWRGYFLSVRSATSRLLLNVQIKHAAVYETGPLSQVIANFRYQNGESPVKLETFLRKVRVEVTHLENKSPGSGRRIPRIKTIRGLASKIDGRRLEHPPQVERYAAGPGGVRFYLSQDPSQPSQTGSGQRGRGSARGRGGGTAQGPSTGRYITVSEFFRTTYNRRVDEGLPVVNVGTRQDPKYLPVDVCVVVPGQPASAKLSPDQTANMIRCAVNKPDDNAKMINENGRQMVGLKPLNDVLARFGLSLSDQMITVPGRILTGPKVKYANDKTVETRFGSWNMQNIRFSSSGKPLRKQAWSYLNITSGNQGLQSAAAANVVQAFQTSLNDNGVRAEPPMAGRQLNITGQNVETAVRNIIGQAASKNIELLLVILPKHDTQIYNAVKYAGDIMYGVHTIDVVGSKFSKQRPDRRTGEMNYDLQFFANVALKFNLKLGGANQSLEPGKLGIVAEGKTMLVGIDVTHPSPGSKETAPSVAGIVASIDRRCSQFPAALRQQESRKEMVTGLRDMVKSRLELWRKQAGNNQRLPENIIVYRDGVSEGQYNLVLENELPSIRAACEGMYSAQETKQGVPKISVIIVGKRHNTRFYPTSTASDQIDERSNNPKNGTVVDRSVTEARDWDFYMQAHTAIQGTARPAHYYVIHDEIFVKRPVPAGFQNAADVLTDLTHNLSYMFGRATKAVSLVPPAYYADLVCERARRYLSREFDPDSSMPPSTVAQESEDDDDEESSGDEGPRDNPLEIHNNLKDTMFYI